MNPCAARFVGALFCVLFSVACRPPQEPDLALPGGDDPGTTEQGVLADSIGLNVGELDARDSSMVDAAVNQAKALGARWVRLPIIANNGAPFDWQNVANQFRAAGIRVL